MSHLMGINDAARRLGVCPDTVRRHIRIGLLQARQKPRGSKYQWLVEVPETRPAEAEPPLPGHVPTAAEYRRVCELADELRHMLAVATAELDARRHEVAQLFGLLDRAHK